MMIGRTMANGNVCVCCIWPNTDKKKHGKMESDKWLASESYKYRFGTLTVRLVAILSCSPYPTDWLFFFFFFVAE